MLPDSVVLKSMIDDATQGGWCYDPAKEYRPGVNGARNIDGPQEGIFSYGGSVTIAVTGPSDDPQSMADAALIALAPALAAEVIRLREECETGAALVLELRGKLEETEAATQDYDHISAVLDGVPVNGPLNPLAARVAKLQAERDEARAEVERLREQLNSTVPADNEEPAQITASWRTAGTEAQLHADDNSDMIGAYWQRAGGGWSAGTPEGVTDHDSREDATAAVEKWAKNCGFLVRQ